MKYILILILLSSCTIEMATQRVRYNNEAFNTIGKEWQQMNPCANDTVTEIIFSPIDSVLILDTLYMMEQITLVDTTSVTSAFKQGYEKGFSKAKEICKANPTTIIKTVVDNSVIKIVKEDLIIAKQNIINKEEQIKKRQKQNRNLIFIIIGLSIVIIGYVSVKLFK